MRFFSDWLCWVFGDITSCSVKFVTWTLCWCNYGIMALNVSSSGYLQSIWRRYNGCPRLSISRFSRYQVHVEPEKLTSWKGDVTWRLLLEIPLFGSSIPNPMGWFNTTLSTALPQRFQKVGCQKAKASKVSWNVLISMSSLNLSRLSIPARSNRQSTTLWWDQNSLKDSTPSSAAWNHVHETFHSQNGRTLLWMEKRQSWYHPQPLWSHAQLVPEKKMNGPQQA